MLLKQNLYDQAVSLRRAGKSYSEIGKELGIAKGTLSGWFSQKEWSQEVMAVLNERWGEISRQRVREMNAERLKRIAQKHEKIREIARQEFTTLIKNPLFGIGLALYWGEGTKVKRDTVAVINSDVRMLQVIIRFYREVLKINETKIRAALFLYADQDEEKMRACWSEKLGLLPTHFIKTQILPSRSTHTKRRVSHGMCSIYFSSRENNIKIHEWIKLLAEHMRE